MTLITFGYIFYYYKICIKVDILCEKHVNAALQIKVRLAVPQSSHNPVDTQFVFIHHSHRRNTKKIHNKKHCSVTKHKLDPLFSMQAPAFFLTSSSLLFTGEFYPSVC